ncbi:MAG: hypothetical protein A2091_07945 [Desulfuromonadales bacterium GWD2_61_12]|nr:MAG: hypothetical protein A2005_03265 [Desulfuromonadales bacterium GWC2_61_20]OGR36080.1 MAG: hypothetical protein A2091_07945 [Desulfuromonadales bacterium GWD2_61_12]
MRLTMAVSGIDIGRDGDFGGDFFGGQKGTGRLLQRSLAIRDELQFLGQGQAATEGQLRLGLDQRKVTGAPTVVGRIGERGVGGFSRGYVRISRNAHQRK